MALKKTKVKKVLIPVSSDTKKQLKGLISSCRDEADFAWIEEEKKYYLTLTGLLILIHDQI